ncbi:hypothetical protein EDEG_00986 [Edhazardia aedis USNM 41457]|uniref:Uncharacterized protein n=1 Tax=Edhazardia aedis (strain USNM 41457) TaxID=1003232 RepID=J9DAN0_EDHAE|nr:hypothetical protein EDEG_00986 [Edhazardia aedis USNM 41457]|eukprot:EJW04816.1 hypothetical protein EDEG_00986 [Edhazardia aedis USNM 41457]
MQKNGEINHRIEFSSKSPVFTTYLLNKYLLKNGKNILTMRIHKFNHFRIGLSPDIFEVDEPIGSSGESIALSSNGSMFYKGLQHRYTDCFNNGDLIVIEACVNIEKSKKIKNNLSATKNSSTSETDKSELISKSNVKRLRRNVKKEFINNMDYDYEEKFTKEVFNNNTESENKDFKEANKLMEHLNIENANVTGENSDSKNVSNQKSSDILKNVDSLQYNIDTYSATKIIEEKHNKNSVTIHGLNNTLCSQKENLQSKIVSEKHIGVKTSQMLENENVKENILNKHKTKENDVNIMYNENEFSKNQTTLQENFSNNQIVKENIFLMNENNEKTRRIETKESDDIIPSANYNGDNSISKNHGMSLCDKNIAFEHDTKFEEISKEGREILLDSDYRQKFEINFDRCSTKLKKNDLDLPSNKKTLTYLRFYRNGEDLGVAFWNLPENCTNFAISLYGACNVELFY